jgi:flagellar basal-body rod protein FlgC
MFRTLDISTTGLVAQRHRMDTIAGNIANVNSTRDDQGNLSPFQRRLVRFQAEDGANPGSGQGVKFQIDVDRDTPARKVSSPGHPDADADGNVAYPNINLVTEFVNAVEASRAYEANVGAIDITKSMLQQTLKLLG